MTTQSSQNAIRQQVALLQELEISIFSIETGLAILRKNRPYAPKPHYFAWLLLLATGFERLMKVIICIQAFEAHGKFPSKTFLARTISHDLLALRNEIVNRCFTSSYLQNRSFAQQDYDFITNNELTEMLLSLLNDFAKSDRYIFMDSIIDPRIGREWPKLRWEELERIALSDSVYFGLIQKGELQDLRIRANIELTACIEKFVRALTRLFVFGELGSLARSNSITVWKFMHLEDDNLGKTVHEV